MKGSVRAMLDEANRAIGALAEQTGSYLFDVAALAERVGTDEWFDPVHWVSYKLPFSAECLHGYAEMMRRILGAIRGKARKCRVLDLDNTIWGGGIGDDGLGGIRLGQGSAMGESFLSVQQCALALRERGIVLAVCSKNTDEVARRPFREHPEMLLREEHIAVCQANWLGKPENLDAFAAIDCIAPNAAEAAAGAVLSERRARSDRSLTAMLSSVPGTSNRSIPSTYAMAITRERLALA